MTTRLLQLLSVCAITVTQLTSSQSTYDVGRWDNERRERTDQLMNQLVKVNSQLVTAVSQLQADNERLMRANSQLESAVSRLLSNVSQLDRDVAGLQLRQQHAAGKLMFSPENIVHEVCRPLPLLCHCCCCC